MAKKHDGKKLNDEQLKAFGGFHKDNTVRESYDKKTNENVEYKGLDAQLSVMKHQKPEPKTINVYGEDLVVKIGNYPNSKLAMSLALETKEGEHYATLSKNFGNYYRDGSFVPLGSTFIDTNNCPLEDIGPVIDALGGEPRTVFGQPYTIQSGFCEYPIYDFNMEKLREYDPEGMDRYSAAWRQECVKEQDKMNEEMFGPDWKKQFADEYPNEVPDDDQDDGGDDMFTFNSN